jgi:hypothetical protein
VLITYRESTCFTFLHLTCIIPSSRSSGRKIHIGRFGGLDLAIPGAGERIGWLELDFIWFGITERMDESVVLY